MTMPPTPPAPAADDPVPADVRTVIDLFESQLAKVSFPDIDAASLRRDADELRAEAKLVARARATLDATVAAFAAKQGALAARAGRAVAYARIYSEAHADRQALATALASLTDVPAATAPTAPTGKRRGRPPRRNADAELFDVTSPTVTTS